MTEEQIKMIREAIIPFARIASWDHLTTTASDELTVKVIIYHPQGKQSWTMNGKDFRLIGEALENIPLTP